MAEVEVEVEGEVEGEGEGEVGAVGRWRRRTICRDLDWVRLEHTARLAHARPEDIDLVVPDGQVVRAVEGVHGTLTRRRGHHDPVRIEDGALARDSGPTDPRPSQTTRYVEPPKTTDGEYWFPGAALM